MKTSRPVMDVCVTGFSKKEYHAKINKNATCYLCGRMHGTKIVYEDIKTGKLLEEKVIVAACKRKAETTKGDVIFHYLLCQNCGVLVKMFPESESEHWIFK